MNNRETTIGVVIPTYNGGMLWEKVVEALQKQCADFDKVLIIDSGSVDNTVQIAQQAGFAIEKISSSDFDFGNTRNIGFYKIDCDIVVFITQDAILMKNAISSIVKAFDDQNVALAYGRQIPHDNASPIAAHVRFFNYKNESYTYELSDKDKNGIKAAFSSNTFAAYRKSYFSSIGGFCKKINASEDMFFAAKALLSGYKICYVSEAICKHSHNYSPFQEFRRYFDIGVLHKNEPWLIKTFGKPYHEGIKFIRSEISFLIKTRKLQWIPFSFVNNSLKMLGYKLGFIYKKIPRKLCVQFSACKPYWRNAP